MVPEKYQLGAVGRFLLEQFELRRPGLKAITPEVEGELRKLAEAEISQMERQLHELGIDDESYWQRARRVIDEILLPRYAKLAQDEIELAGRDYDLWRGGDLIARATYAGIGFFLGILCVEIPYIPISVKWFPVIPFIAGPFFPDIVTGLHARRYRKKLAAIVTDLDKASGAIETYRPLSELTKAMERSAELMEPPPVPSRERH
jgi:hypothetical protein